MSSLKIVDPSLQKIDLPHLTRDIERYHNVGVLPASEYLWWKEFLDSFEQNFTTGQRSSSQFNCLLKKLYEIKARSVRLPLQAIQPVIPKQIHTIHSNQISYNVAKVSI